MLEFLGQLLGIAVRTCNPLALDLPAFFWKPLIGAPLTRQDLEQVDYSVCKSWDAINAMNQEDFEASVFETFQVSLSDGTRVPLLPAQPELAVDYANRSRCVTNVINIYNSYTLFPLLQIHPTLRGSSSLRERNASRCSATRPCLGAAPIGAATLAMDGSRTARVRSW